MIKSENGSASQARLTSKSCRLIWANSWLIAAAISLSETDANSEGTINIGLGQLTVAGLLRLCLLYTSTAAIRIAFKQHYRDAYQHGYRNGYSRA